MPFSVLAKYPGSKVLKDFISANTAYKTGTFTDLGNVTMGALQGLQVGRGAHTGQESAVGRAWASLYDTSATPVAVSGRVQLFIYDPNGVPVAGGLVMNERTEALALPASDVRQGALPLPLRTPKVYPNYSLHLLLNVDTGLGDSGTLSLSGSKFYADTTEYTLQLT